MLDWNKLISTKRLGLEDEFVENVDIARSQFQRDYDRIIFSSPFRRLQNKTQIFPLPGSVFVHNRLTHSLEVASVGRTLGNKISYELRQKKVFKNPELLDELGTIVSTACIAHDLGNPPFGHSGEKAISRYFIEFDKNDLQKKLSAGEYQDLINFEGNANALRLLTNQFSGRRKGGFSLTYSTLATILKYPCTSIQLKNNNTPYEKYGVFDAERDVLHKIAQEVGLHKITDDVYARHPLVFLMEAADDICYQIVDIEDAHRLNILSTSDSKELLLAFFDSERNRSQLDNVHKTLQDIHDENEQITILRSRVINKLIDDCVEIFRENYDLIMNAELHSSLMNNLHGSSKKALSEVKKVAKSKIYNTKSVTEIQIAGHRILAELLEEYVNAVLSNNTLYTSQLLQLLPSQLVYNGDDLYRKILSVIDFIAGMTDVYALEVYRKIRGISFDVVR